MCFGGRLILLLTGVCVIFQMKTTPCVTGLVKFCHSCRRGRYTCVNSGFLSNIDTKIRDSSLPTTPYDVTEVTHQHWCHFCDLKEGQSNVKQEAQYTTANVARPSFKSQNWHKCQKKNCQPDMSASTPHDVITFLLFGLWRGLKIGKFTLLFWDKKSYILVILIM